MHSHQLHLYRQIESGSMRKLRFAILAMCLCWTDSGAQRDARQQLHAGDEAANLDDIQGEILHSTLRTTPSWSNDLVNSAETGDMISINGRVQLHDSATIKLSTGVIAIIRTTPDGRDLHINSKLVKFEQKQPGEYIFSNNIRGPVDPGVYRVKIRYLGKVIMEGPLEIR